MTFLTPTTGGIILAVFAAAMIGITWLLTHRRSTSLSGFLVADRAVGPVQGALSTAVTFIWAPALFVCSLTAFSSGIAGIWWFVFPNLLCFVIFAFVAKRVRREHPNGFTLTQLIGDRVTHPAAHVALLAIFMFWMLAAVVINCVAGGTMLSAVSGINFYVAVIGLGATAMLYSLISGLRASIVTDVLQMTMVVGIALIIVPWVVLGGSGVEGVTLNLRGTEGSLNPFDPATIYSLGILASLGLIGGTLQDQMFYQRAYSVNEKHIVKMFLVGGALFAIVPIALSLLGFVGAGLVGAGAITVDNPEMVGPSVIAYYLPKWALIAFVFMAFAGLASTLDSAFCALSSLISVDVYERYVRPNSDDDAKLRAARVGMAVVGLLGLAIALLRPNILWIFKTYAAIAVGGLAPVLFIIFGRTPKASAVVASVLVGLGVSLPSAIYGNVVGNNHIVLWGTLGGLAFSTAVCVLFVRRPATSPPGNI